MARANKPKTITILSNEQRYVSNWDTTERGGDRRTTGYAPGKNRGKHAGFKVVLVLNKAGQKLNFPKITQNVTTKSDGKTVTLKSTLEAVVGMKEVSAAQDRRLSLFSGEQYRIDITNFVKELTWNSSSEEPYVSCNFTLDNRDSLFNYIPRGTLILIQRRKPLWNSKGKYHPYIATYLWQKERSGSQGSKQMTFTSYDKLYLLAKSDFSAPKPYTKDTKAHKKGWTANQIIRDICKKNKIPVGTIGINSKVPLGRVEVPDGTFLDAITHVLTLDKKKSKRKHKVYINMHDGKLNIIPATTYQKAKYMYRFTDAMMIESGSVTEKEPEAFATQLILKPNTTSTKKNKKKKVHKSLVNVKRLTINPDDPNIQTAFGIIKKEEFTLGTKGEQTRAQAIKYGKDKLASMIRGNVEASFTSRGIPGLWPGTCIVVSSELLGLHGMYVIDAISYNLGGGQFTMDISLKPYYKKVLTKDQANKVFSRRLVRY